MNDRQKKSLPPVSVGYTSVIMIFAVLCLTILAVLSYQAAGSGNVLTDRNAQFTKEYYAADSKAKAALSKLDEAAVTALQSGFFNEIFTELAGELGAETANSQDGIKVSFSEPLNDRLTLNAEIIFYSAPKENRYKILKWSTVSADNSNGNNPPSLWDGEF